MLFLGTNFSPITFRNQMAIISHPYYHDSKLMTAYIINITSNISFNSVYSLHKAGRMHKTEMLAKESTPLKYWILCLSNKFKPRKYGNWVSLFFLLLYDFAFYEPKLIC